MFLTIKTNGQVNEEALLYPTQMREDVRFLYKTLTETHPNPYQILTKEQLEVNIQKIINELDSPLSIKEFWLRIGVLNSFFDGHTRVEYLPNMERYLIERIKDKRNILKIQDNSILFNSQYPVIDSNLWGKKIISINNILSQELLKNTKKYVSYEPLYQELILPLLIIPVSVHKFQNDSLIHIEYIDEKSPEKKKITLPFNYQETIKQEDVNFSTDNNKYLDIKQEVCALSLYSTDKIAIIELNDFSSSMPFDEYCSKIEGYMNQINDSNIQHLFIDITSNGGGNSSKGIEFLNYIQTKEKEYKIERTGIKISPLFIEQKIIEEPSKNLNELDSILKSIDSTLKLGDIVYEDSYWIKKNRLPLYNNNLYLIVSRNTYSAAIDLAVIFSHYKLGVVIGEETGGLTSCYIDILPIELPNSNIWFSCSHKDVVYVGDKGNGRGVLPDIEYKIGNSAKSFTLEQLKEMLRLVEQYKMQAK